MFLCGWSGSEKMGVGWLAWCGAMVRWLAGFVRWFNITIGQKADKNYTTGHQLGVYSW